MSEFLKATPWDQRTFKIDTYELTSASEAALEATHDVSGHFTLKVSPNENTQALHDHGFYYVDTLTKPACQRKDLKIFHHDFINLSQTYERDKILNIAENTFTTGRYHRDFNIPDRLANRRYMRWVDDLMDEKKIYALAYKDQVVGFYGFTEDQVLLLGLDKNYQGLGLAKPYASLGCEKQFESGYKKLFTSISPANLPSLNLFLALGFKLEASVDVYHKLNGPAPKVGG